MIATHDLDFGRRLYRRFILLEDGKVTLDDEDIRAVERLWDFDKSVE